MGTDNMLSGKNQARIKDYLIGGSQFPRVFELIQ